MTKRIDWQVIMIIVLGITLISVTVYAINKETESIAEMEPEKVYVGHDGEILDNFTKHEAVKSMTETLDSIDKDIEGKERTIEERMKALDNGKADLEDVINQDTIDRLHLASEFKGSEFNRQFTASALLTYKKMIDDYSQGDNLGFSKETLEEMVYLDEKLMTAHIPIDVFMGSNLGLAFEMQYIDGEWKFNPYTSMMSLIMMINYESQMQEILIGPAEEDS